MSNLDRDPYEHGACARVPDAPRVRQRESLSIRLSILSVEPCHMHLCALTPLLTLITLLAPCRSQQISDMITTLSVEDQYLTLTLPAIGQSHVLQQVQQSELLMQ